jgi:hypothetical protein
MDLSLSFQVIDNMPVTSLSGARAAYKTKIKRINDIQDAIDELQFGGKKLVELTEGDLATKGLTKKDLVWFIANQNISMKDKSLDQRVINNIHNRITKKSAAPR